jgi:hypothetical protein
VTLKAIQTAYRGYRFRSRLEARWAVFLDAAAIEWDYEIEGFNLDGTYYLPDFWLRRSQAFLEIKPEAPSWFEGAKVHPVLTALANTTKTEVFLIQGAPCPEDPGDIYVGKCQGFVPHIVSFAPQKGICSARLFECPYCGRVAFRRLLGKMWCECRDGEFEDTNYNGYVLSPRIRQAMLKARQARFEHGESGMIA